MSKSIDLYEWRGKLDKFQGNEKWIFEGTPKTAYVIEVGDTPDYIQKQLINSGYETDDRIMIVVQ